MKVQKYERHATPLHERIHYFFEVMCQALFICANFKVVVSGIGGRIPRL